MYAAHLTARSQPFWWSGMSAPSPRRPPGQDFCSGLADAGGEVRRRRRASDQDAGGSSEGHSAFGRERWTPRRPQAVARLDPDASIGREHQRGVAFLERCSAHGGLRGCGGRPFADGSIFDCGKRAAVSTAAVACHSRATLTLDGDSGEAGSATRVDLCTAPRKQQPHARGENGARSPIRKRCWGCWIGVDDAAVSPNTGTSGLP